PFEVPSTGRGRTGSPPVRITTVPEGRVLGVSPVPHPCRKAAVRQVAVRSGLMRIIVLPDADIGSASPGPCGVREVVQILPGRRADFSDHGRVFKRHGTFFGPS